MLGENIYNLRKEKKLSQEQLAELVNVTRQTISNWELGSTAPNPEQLKLLSKAFHVSIDELLGNDIENILTEKVSNTERLAGIAIKILKGIGIIFIILLVIDIISFLIFLPTKKLTNIENGTTIVTVCTIEDQSYEIELGTDNHFQCDNCSSKMETELKELVDFNDISKSMDKIEQYFIDKQGNCE